MKGSFTLNTERREILDGVKPWPVSSGSRYRFVPRLESGNTRLRVSRPSVMIRGGGASRTGVQAAVRLEDIHQATPSRGLGEVVGTVPAAGRRCAANRSHWTYPQRMRLNPLTDNHPYGRANGPKFRSLLSGILSSSQGDGFALVPGFPPRC